jgi:hypothetical protein
MKLPKSWSEIDVLQFKEIRELYSIEEVFTREIEILATLADIPSDELEDFDIDDVSEMLADIKFVNSEPSKQYKHQLDNYHYKPLKLLTVGEFIDLEFYFSKDYNQHIGHIASIMYRKTLLNEWGDKIYEPYNFSPRDRFELFDEYPINDIYGIIPEFISFRENFMKTYGNLFHDDNEDDEDDDIKPTTSQESKELQLKKSEIKWGWERLIYNLCNEDLTKFEDVTNLPLVLTFNMLGMKKELNI